MELSDLARRMRLAREASGLDVKKAAKRLGVTEGAVRHWENDQRKPSLKQFPDIARLYKVSIDWLFTGHGKGPKDPDNGSDELLETWDKVETQDRPRALQALKIFASGGRR